MALEATEWMETFFVWVKKFPLMYNDFEGSGDTLRETFLRPLKSLSSLFWEQKQGQQAWQHTTLRTLIGRELCFTGNEEEQPIVVVPNVFLFGNWLAVPLYCLRKTSTANPCPERCYQGHSRGLFLEPVSLCVSQTKAQICLLYLFIHACLVLSACFLLYSYRVCHNEWPCATVLH